MSFNVCFASFHFVNADLIVDLTTMRYLKRRPFRLTRRDEKKCLSVGIMELISRPTLRSTLHDDDEESFILWGNSRPRL